MKLPPSAYRVSDRGVCMWRRECKLPATFGAKLVLGQNHDIWLACEVHFRWKCHVDVSGGSGAVGVRLS